MKVGSWVYMDGIFYIVVNSGGTLEKHGPLVWYKRAWLEILDCIDRPMSLRRLREFIA
jgi:hypothetical protein